MQICIVSTQLCYILMQKEWHFNFKKWDVKTRWLCLKMAEIAFPRTWNFKIFRGRMPDPPTGGPPSAPPLFKPPMLKTWIRARGGQLETLKPAALVHLKPRWPSIYSKHLTILFYSPLNKLCWPFPKKIIFLILYIHTMISNPLYQKYYLQGHTPSLKLLAVPWQIHLSVMKHWQ